MPDSKSRLEKLYIQSQKRTETMRRMAETAKTPEDKAGILRLANCQDRLTDILKQRLNS